MLSRESLTLLFDPSRLETLYQQANQCRTIDRDIAPNPNATRALNAIGVGAGNHKGLPLHPNATFVKVFRSPNFSLGEPTPKINLGLLIPRLRAFILNLMALPYTRPYNGPHFMFPRQKFSLRENFCLGRQSFMVARHDMALTRALLEPVAVFRNIQFKMRRFDLNSVSKQQLTEIVSTRARMDARNIKIGGHSDSQPWKGQTPTRSRQLNLKLSQNRAESVKSYLVNQGISQDRIKTEGYGENRPLVKANNKSAWAQNRRVEIEVKK
ncbi:hypothetical protein PN36_15195 [Candidatus Thiomargarita nelsonii]|uniref:OmpA-like domain-containing protein n=1 Tax=Candidatus Thiomargarita nelsonii TaxID=1003181 RepID=A0A4E0QQ43_9GAMM|nr:hypothetical protein PN36_15195 [Candidatus Thiomargarita nelsonii]